MAIRIRETAEALSDESLASPAESILNYAPSAAARLFRQELIRYCAGQIHGRSFLIAGHRGAGKTTMVNTAVDEVLRDCRHKGETKLLRPLPVFLHGPSLFELEQDTPAAGMPARKSEAAALQQQAKVVLVHVILGLHRAVVREFVRCFRARLVPFPGDETAGTPDGDLLELAAEFEVEILENPSALRLKEFWDHAAATRAGVLFKNERATDQGYRELVALNGMCNAHQRISGEISAKDATGRSASTEESRASGAELKWADLVRPLISVVAGSAVATGSAAGTGDIVGAGVAGLLTALLASTFFKTSTTTTDKSSRQLDTTFIPDLSHKTLDRILPTLLQRLRCAGLAPVFIIDELDKVPNLSQKLQGMIHFLKKLVAENVFTCFLTDRGYIEYLRVSGQENTYGLAYSYFTHPLLITFSPADFDSYLQALLIADDRAPAAATPGAAPASTPSELDLQVLKWVLRHRSRLHALALAREVAALRGDDGRIALVPGKVRSDYPYRIDVTFQVAIESQLRRDDVVGWQKQRPSMLQTLNDTLYFLSREWAGGGASVQLGQAGKEVLKTALEKRMNLEEARDNGAEDGTQMALNEDDVEMLISIVQGMIAFLGEKNSKAEVDVQWNGPLPATGARAQAAQLEQSVLDTLLLGEQSLLRPGGATVGWRYFTSGAPRPVTGKPAKRAPADFLELARADARAIREIEGLLATALGLPPDPASHAVPVFQLLADHLRLLPTSPAWQHVAAATDRIGQSGAATLSEEPSLREDCRAITEFLGVLRASATVVSDVLVYAAAWGALAAEEHGPADAMRKGLDILSTGLRFSATHVVGIGQAIAQLSNQLALLPAANRLARLVKTRAGQRSFGDALLQELDQARKLGSDLGMTADWSQFEQEAWNELLQRCNVLHLKKQAQSARPHELLCAARSIGPSALVPLDLQAVPLRTWTSVLLAPMRAARASPELPPPPAWFGAFALRQLGAASLAPPILNPLYRLLAIGGNSETKHERAAAREFLGSGGHEVRLGVLLTRKSESVADRWFDPPEDGALLVAAERDWQDLSNALAGFREGRPPLLVALEEPANERPDLPDILARLGAASTPLPHLHVYAQKIPDMKSPSIADPQGPGDILAFHRPN